MITWKLKKISLRFIESIAFQKYLNERHIKIPNLTGYSDNETNDELKDIVTHFFIVATLLDDSEKLLYTATYQVDPQLKNQIIESLQNNDKALICGKDENASVIVKGFANIKIKNFSDVQIEIENDITPMPFGQYIGQDVRTLKKYYKKSLMNGSMAQHIKKFTRLEKYF